MLYATYSYVLGFPVTVMNCLWVLISAIFFTTLALNHILATKSKVSQFLSQYGKAKSIHVDFDLPKRWFTHFYIVASSFNFISCISIIAGCTGSLFYMSLFSWMNIRASVTPSGDRLSLVIAILLLTIQSFRRLYECLYVSVFSKNCKTNAHTLHMGTVVLSICDSNRGVRVFPNISLVSRIRDLETLLWNSTFHRCYVYTPSKSSDLCGFKKKRWSKTEFSWNTSGWVILPCILSPLLRRASNLFFRLSCRWSHVQIVSSDPNLQLYHSL
ncbi:polyprenal reductase-like [Ciona intestinalis]